MTIPFLTLDRQVAGLRSEALQAIENVVQTQAFANGPMVARFEKQLAEFLGVSHVVGVNSGTSALHAALICAGVGPGDEVVTVAHTWISTAWAISYVGAVPRFVDVEPRTCGMDPERVEATLTRRTRAIVPVHLYGQPVELAPILEVAERHGLPVIEDAAQAIGARYADGRAGSLGARQRHQLLPREEPRRIRRGRRGDHERCRACQTRGAAAGSCAGRPPPPRRAGLQLAYGRHPGAPCCL